MLLINLLLLFLKSNKRTFLFPPSRLSTMSTTYNITLTPWTQTKSEWKTVPALSPIQFACQFVKDYDILNDGDERTGYVIAMGYASRDDHQLIEKANLKGYAIIAWSLGEWDPRNPNGRTRGLMQQDGVIDFKNKTISSKRDFNGLSTELNIFFEMLRVEPEPTIELVIEDVVLYY